MILLGKKVKELRNKHRLTQSELANLVGVSKSTIAAYENDSRLPSYDVLVNLATTFKTSTDALLLDKPEHTLNVDDLTIEQLELLNSLIIILRNGNRSEQALLQYYSQTQIKPNTKQ